MEEEERLFSVTRGRHEKTLVGGKGCPKNQSQVTCPIGGQVTNTWLFSP